MGTLGIYEGYDAHVVGGPYDGLYKNYFELYPNIHVQCQKEAVWALCLIISHLFRVSLLRWTLKPFENYLYIGSPIQPIRQNIKYPRGLPS